MMRDDKKKAKDVELATTKSRAHIPMSERQQFALLKQMETEEGHCDKDPSASSVDNPESDNSHLVHPPCSSNRDRSTTASHEKRETKRQISNPESNLIRLINSGDLNSMKQLIKGVDVNEQDELGWTALHEVCVRNLTRMVGYLLRHGADPNLKNINGDTALHSAVRHGHARVIRTLLRYNANPLLVNNKGEQPMDLCQDADISIMLNQHSQQNSASVTTPTNSAPSKFTHVKISRHSTSTYAGGPSSSLINSKHSTNLEQHNVGKSNSSSTSTPDVNSDSDDNCSINGLSTLHTTTNMVTPPLTAATTTTNSVFITSSPNHHHHHHHHHHQSSPNQTISPSICNSSKCTTLEQHSVVTKSLKKDPYAFEDEADETTDLNSSSLQHVSGSTTLNKSNSPNSSNKVRPFSNIHSTVVSSGIAADPVSSTSNLENSNLSTTTGLVGPPLRLRLTKEAGYYTLMEQQQTSPSASELNLISTGTSISAIAPTGTSTTDSFINQLYVDGNSHSDEFHTLVHVTSNINPSICTTSTSDSSSVMSKHDQQTDEKKIHAQTPSSASSMEPTSEDFVVSQKVPPLRIKFASGTSSTETTDCATPTTSAAIENNHKSHSSTKDIPLDIQNDDEEMKDVKTTVRSTDLSDSSSKDQLSAITNNSSTVCEHLKKCDQESEEFNQIKSSTSSSSSSSNAPNLTYQSSNQHSSEHNGQLSGGLTRLVDSISESNKDTIKETNRHRSGRTLRSHTAAQREREEKERHSDITPIKKRKLRSRTDTNQENSSCSTHSPPASPMNTGKSSTDNPNGGDSSEPQSTVSPNPSFHMNEPISTDDQHKPTINSQPDNVDVSMPAVTEMDGTGATSSSFNGSTITLSSATSSMNDLDCKTEASSLSPTHSQQQSTYPSESVTSSHGSSNAFSLRTQQLNSDEDSFLIAPMGPGEDRKQQQLELLKFQNPYEKAAAVNKCLRDLVNNLVEVHPKAPCGYQDYLLVTRNYLLTHKTPTIIKRLPPNHLDAAFVELFTEQEEERYAQSLKHQSEREHLQLCAEQAVLRAQTRAALAVANLPRPLSFCSILAFKDLTYVPPVKSSENREEESIRDRFTPRTFIGWLQDIKDTFEKEKKKLLCRQLHEAESLMMVQKLDWEMKARETQLNDTRNDLFRDIPLQFVPLTSVPNDFPLFAHDPVHRTTP